ncbi:MAG: NAD(P)H-dependent oxidoreductase [Gemmatimonadota bacterium]|nr:NAD(P)H-dependent oxidoreductase [Gemmatimonadota bacterium]
MPFLAISGSLRTGASNTALLEAAQLLAPPNVVISMYGGIAQLPHFNPDLEERELPEPARALRDVIAHTDGVIISTPEYAHGLPGSFKNALDWLVGSTEFPGMPVMIMSASSSSMHAPASLREVLRTMSARLVTEADVTVELRGRSPAPTALVADAKVAEVIRQGLTIFARRVAELRGSP